MATPYNVTVIVGSLRKESLNRKLANVLISQAPPALKLSILEIADLPHFNEDWEANPPATVTEFKKAITAADAVLFITPEYNRSVPGVLKNAIDVGSRPYGQSAWNGKPGAVLSLSPGAIGGYGANHHLRQSMVFLNVPLLPHEAYIGGAAKLFTPEGELTEDSTKAFLDKFLTNFADWVQRNHGR
ncbi:MAG: hypothetical protein RLZZ618_3445 [Pseudomonadota bacterium]|jgi:chromate reductase